VLRAIRSGSSTGAIAKALGISLSTVRRHVARILIRLDDPPRVVGANGSSRRNWRPSWCRTFHAN
jgi:DNA-binding NarL/FixJ family response regulator